MAQRFSPRAVYPPCRLSAGIWFLPDGTADRPLFVRPTEAGFVMAIPGYLHLGFFAEDSVGQWQSHPRVVLGQPTDAFEDCLRELLGELLVGEEGDGPLYRDKHGVVTVSLWELIGQDDLVRRLLQLQSRSGCQAVESRGFSSHLIHPNCLEGSLRYCVEECREVVTTWEAPREEEPPPSGADA